MKQLSCSDLSKPCAQLLRLWAWHIDLISFYFQALIQVLQTNSSSAAVYSGLHLVLLHLLALTTRPSFRLFFLFAFWIISQYSKVDLALRNLCLWLVLWAERNSYPIFAAEASIIPQWDRSEAHGDPSEQHRPIVCRLNSALEPGSLQWAKILQAEPR